MVGSVIERSIGEEGMVPLRRPQDGTEASAMKLGVVFGYWGAAPRAGLRRGGAGGRAPRLRLGVGGGVVGQRRLHLRRVGRRAHRRRSRSAPASCRWRRARRPPPRWPRSRSTTSRTAGSSSASASPGPQVVEGWYGQPSNKPLARTREYVEIIRRALRREGPLEFDGEFYPLPYRGRGQRRASASRSRS